MEFPSILKKEVQHNMLSPKVKRQFVSYHTLVHYILFCHRAMAQEKGRLAERAENKIEVYLIHAKSLAVKLDRDLDQDLADFDSFEERVRQVVGHVPLTCQPSWNVSGRERMRMRRERQTEARRGRLLLEQSGSAVSLGA